MTFGSRLTAARKKAGLTQGELGRGLGTDGADAGKQVVYGWEKDQHYPRVDQLIKICQKLNCSADFLLFGVESAVSPKYALAKSAVAQLSDEERLQLLAAIAQPGLEDAKVEEFLPASPRRLVADETTQPYADQSVTGKTALPVGKPSPSFLDTLPVGSHRSASSPTGEVQKPGSRKGPKRAA